MKTELGQKCKCAKCKNSTAIVEKTYSAWSVDYLGYKNTAETMCQCGQRGEISTINKLPYYERNHEAVI